MNANGTLSRRHKAEITDYFRSGLPLSTIAPSYNTTEEAILADLSSTLFKARLMKLSDLCVALDEMALSQKSVTLSLAWFKLQLDDLTQLAAKLTEPSLGADECISDLQSMSDESLRDEIQKLLV